MIKEWTTEAWDVIQKVIVWIFTTSLTYFLPIKSFVHLLIILLVIDMVIGYWANKKTRGEKFMFSKFWATTAPRMLLGTVFLMTIYAYDEIYKQTDISTYVWCGRLLSGAVLVSIAQNAFRITNWSVLNEMAEMVKDKVTKTLIIKAKTKL